MFEPNRGKKPHKFTYTYMDIARLTGLTLNTVRQYASKGKYDPYNLASTIEFISHKLAS